MRLHGRRRALLTAVLAGLLLASFDAWPARAPDVVKKSFSYRASGARALAALLELPPAPRTVIDFDLSQATEHRALPDRDLALRDPDGTLSSALDWRPSTQIHEAATWDPATDVLSLDGYVDDMSTALPTQEGPRWRFTSPMFTESDVDAVPAGWRRLLSKLAALPAKAMPGGALVRRIGVTLDGSEHAALSLWRLQTWDSKNDPVLKSFLRVEFGPPVGARASGSERGQSGSSHACGCKVGPADAAPSAWAITGALLVLTRRRRAYFA